MDHGRGRHRRGRLLAALGYGLVLASAYIGGSLVSSHRVGVDHADRRLEPRQFVTALPAAEVQEDHPRRAVVEGVAVLVVRSQDKIYALGEQCAHLGGPLSEGWVYRDSVVCPWHGSRYDLATGRNLVGPATSALPCFQTRIVDGQVQVRRPPPVPGATPGSVLAREQGHADAGH